MTNLSQIIAEIFYIFFSTTNTKSDNFYYLKEFQLLFFTLALIVKNICHNLNDFATVCVVHRDVVINQNRYHME